MKYRIELTATAKADIRESAQWRREEISAAAADSWLAGLYKAISTLETKPYRCPVAAESPKFPDEIRELLYGRKKRSKHRIIFKIDADVIYILYIRHTARDELEP